MIDMIKKITVAGPVIIKDNKVLLIRDKDDSFWKFPGGTIQKKESHEEALHREVKEEIGVEVEIIGKPIKLEIKKADKHITLLHYLAKLKSEKFKLGSDIIGCQWHDTNNLPANCAQNIKPVLKTISSQ